MIAVTAKGSTSGMGGTRLLQEIGWRVLRDGHVPLLLGPYQDPRATPTTSLGSGARRAAGGLVLVAAEARPAAVRAESAAVRARRRRRPALLAAVERGTRRPSPAMLRQALQPDARTGQATSTRRLVRDLLADDLAELARRVATTWGPPFGEHTRAVLLCDDVHEWAAPAAAPPAARSRRWAACWRCWTPSGLGRADRPAPVVFTASTTLGDGGTVAGWSATGRPGFLVHPMDDLTPEECVVGYQWVLLHPWTTKPAEERELFGARIHLAARAGRRTGRRRCAPSAGGPRASRTGSTSPRTLAFMQRELPPRRRRGRLEPLRREQPGVRAVSVELQLDRGRGRVPSAPRTARFDPAALLWLAALPEWTDRRAALVGFPPAGEELPACSTGCDAAGLLARRVDVDVDGELLTAFWLPASRRAEVGAYLRTRGSGRRAARRGCRARRGARRLPDGEGCGRGCVVDRHLDDATGAGLRARSTALVAAGRAAEALGLVSAAQALGDVLGEPLVSSARRAQWRIDRSVPPGPRRPDGGPLPAPPAGRGGAAGTGGRARRRWALHLLGDGGVGKTMAVRDLARVGSPPGAGCPSPRRPRRLRPPRPALPARSARPSCCSRCVGELFTHSRDARGRSPRSAPPTTRCPTARVVGATPAADPRLLDAAVEAFADFSTTSTASVVLVLDTCEELAKLHPPGGRAPAVDRHVRAAGAAARPGRRGCGWCSPAGGGWCRRRTARVRRPRARPAALPAGRAARRVQPAPGPRLPRPPRPRRARGAPPLRAARAGALRRRAGGANPYDLACYCDWALAEPDLDPAACAPPRATPTSSSASRPAAHRGRARLPRGRRRARPFRPKHDRAGTRAAAAIDVDAAFSGLVGQEWVSAVTFDRRRPARRRRGRPAAAAAAAGRPRRASRTASRTTLRRWPRPPGARGDSTLPPELAVEAVEAALRLLPVAEAGRDVA